MAKVLLVEDDFSLRDIYSARFQAEGFEVVTASNGEEALTAAMLDRLALEPRGPEDDIPMVSAAFRALAVGGPALRWEPLFFDWFAGAASEDRAMGGPRAGLYAGEAFADFRHRLRTYSPVRPERLGSAYFANPEPEELLIDEVEALWAPIAKEDDWGPLKAKLDRIEALRAATMLP